jgi:hypothetical protein
MIGWFAIDGKNSLLASWKLLSEEKDHKVMILRDCSHSTALQYVIREGKR